jgi:hypothetical protein
MGGCRTGRHEAVDDDVPARAGMPGAEDMPVPGFRADRRWGFSSERLGITFRGLTPGT